jgi:hypothetical protein
VIVRRYSSLYLHMKCSFIPSGKKYKEVEMLMGGVSSFRKIIFENIFGFQPILKAACMKMLISLRLAKKGKLYLNTAAAIFMWIR